MAMIGHNSASLASAAEANVETGIWLLCKEFLVTAIQDRNLERGHLKVLACFVQLMNKNTGKAWPSRASICAMTGFAESSVSNYLSELRRHGYLICERERVEQSGNRILTVYTFGRVDHDTIRSEISKFCERIQLERTSPPTVKSKSPPTVKFTTHGEASSPPTVNMTSPPAVASNSRDNNNPSTKKTTVERGSRLPEDWFLPKAWGEWTVANFEVSPTKVRAEAERFKNYWLAKSRDATKRDWFRTWKNWVSDERKGWKPRAETPEQHAPDLVSSMAPSNSVHDEWEAARRITEVPDD